MLNESDYSFTTRLEYSRGHGCTINGMSFIESKQAISIQSPPKTFKMMILATVLCLTSFKVC